MKISDMGGDSRTNNAECLLCVERYGTREDAEPSIYFHDTNSGKVKLQNNSINTSSTANMLKSVFLPQGYPESVSDDYFEYQIWDTIQAFCSSITGALATQAVLKGSGVGDDTANVASATITWLLKDGTGMVGRIAFAYYNGVNLDRDAKRWRLFADVLNDCATFTTLIAPIFPKQYFTAITCLAGVAFALVGVAGGCTRAAITMHQAQRDNMADVSAKDGSQETLVNLTALIINLALIPTVSGNAHLLWTLFVIFTFLHIFANYKAVTCIVMDTFNYARFKVVFNHCYISPGFGEILHPKEANLLEPIITRCNSSWIRVGCRLDELKLDTAQFNQHMLSRDTKSISQYRKEGNYLAALRDTAKSEDMLKAYHEAETWKCASLMTGGPLVDFIGELRKNGWDVSRHHLNVDEWRWSTRQTDKTK